MVRKLTPIKAIRAKCLDCTCWSTTEVEQCTAKDCPLWGYRLGHRPDGDVLWEDGKVLDEKTIEARRQAGERLKDARQRNRESGQAG